MVSGNPAYVCKCLCACMWACGHVCMCACVHVCMCACVRVRVRTLVTKLVGGIFGTTAPLWVIDLGGVI